MTGTATTEPRRLILMRHAKSSWDDPAQEDHDRPLARRGRLAATLMAAWLRETDSALKLGPLDAALISDSRRTRETWAQMTPLWGGDAEARFDNRIYEAPTSSLIDALRTAPRAARRVLMLGHNPGMLELAADLAGRPSGRFPTAAIAVLTPRDPAFCWADAGPHAFDLLAYEEPKGLV